MKYLIAACLLCSAFGCATDDSQQAGAAPSSSSRGEGAYRTGSRLPSYDPPGTAASREMSADDWNDARRTGGNQGNAR